MKQIIFIFISSLLLVACNSSTTFKISGKIENADNETLFLEQAGLAKTIAIDSIKLNKNGEFSFKGDRPEYPEFFQLRIGKKNIILGVDSCEKININANATDFSMNYKVEGSEASLLIQQLRKSVNNIQKKVYNLTPEMSSDESNRLLSEIEKDIELHKSMAQKLILQNPRSLAAYFAIYQKINDVYLFSPYVKADRPFCAAVATSFHTFMPEYERSINLYNLVMDAIKTQRKEVQNQAWNEVLASASAGYIEIDLKDRNNQIQKLSDLEGKVVLIDFSAYEMENSVEYTFELRNLYNKYHTKGFEIYQISLDRNKMNWEQVSENIPWVCVRDEEGPNTKFTSVYNISSIPTVFLMNKKGEIIGRDYNFTTLEKEIQKLL